MRQVMRPTSFNEWIRHNGAAVRRRISLRGTLDEDAFQDAYLCMATAPETEVGCEADFMRIYRRHVAKNLGEAFSTCHPDELFFLLLPSRDAEPMEDAPEEDAAGYTAAIIRKFIRATFPRRDVRMLELRLFGFPYRDIADAFGIRPSAINGIINSIITRTRREFAGAAL